MAITTSRRASHPLRGLISAVQFLTRIPISTPADETFDLAAAAAWFPLVGAAIGLTTGGVIWLAAHVWSAWPAVVLGLVCEALLTGALHEDALADVCDGFGGGWTRDDVLRIFEDSRVGSYGVLGLCLAVLLRADLFASLAPGNVVAAAMASATLGRWAILPAMAALAPIAGRSSLAEQSSHKLGGRQVLFGSLLALPGVLPMAWLLPVRLVCAGAVLLLLVPMAAAYFRRRLGGLTGDCLGALCYLAQLGVLASAAAGWTP
ncbi:MAG TPA: adenosylcobinamide-GDP ribazoletransferase [Pirellulales bacterium]|jgi:adenosylcobinamide-GDP ribazoletransferase|nr:adenosylcobinamide-GDP ribazoletransferase [Pirellulales bacterium]